MLVTSRLRLAALAGARGIELDALAPQDAAELFARLADRPGLEPADTARVVAASGYLPLAVSRAVSVCTTSCASTRRRWPRRTPRPSATRP